MCVYLYIYIPYVYYCTTNINLSLIFGTLYLWPFSQHFPHNIIIVGLNLEYPSTFCIFMTVIRSHTQSYAGIRSHTINFISSYPEIAKQKCCVSGRDVPDTTLPDIGFKQIVTYRIPNILDTR